MSGRVFVVGSLNIDTVHTVPAHPRVGETIHAVTTTTVPGGKGGNQAVAAAAAGAPTIMVGAVGDDGGRYLEHLGCAGVDTSGVRRAAGVATGAATVIVNAEGDNSIIVTYGANGAVSAEQLAAIALRPGDVVSLQFELRDDVLRAAATWAKEAGATLIVNPSPWRAGLDEVLALADVVLVNELEAADLPAAVPAERICLTLGGDGARWGDLCASAPAISPVDTTGAGDAFAGTLSARLALGSPRAQALQEAVAAASELCLRHGAQQWRS